MTDQTELGEPTTVYQIESEGPISVSDAADAIANARASAGKKTPEEEQPAAPEAPAEENAAPPEEAPGETEATDQAQEEEVPPIDPPRSWSAEDKELFNTLPRETQERLADRERARERDFLRRQNQAAEQRKAAEAEAARAAQARAQYEQTLPALVNQIQAQIAGEFADVKSWDDVAKMQAEDPLRYQRFDLAIKRAQVAQAQVAEIQQRQSQEAAQRWEQFRTAEDAKFSEVAPEMSNPEKAKALRENAFKTLRDHGFSQQEMGAAWEGRTNISLRDHRVQLLIRDAALYREAQAKAKQVRQAPVPPVQKPGTARPAGAGNEAEIKSITEQLKTATGRRALELGTKLTQLRRPA